MARTLLKLLLPLALFAAALSARGAVLDVVPVRAQVYALVGPLGQRDAANAGDNATFGAVLTPEGVILIDSGAGDAGAQLIAQALRGVTSLPVRWVINTGSQDHRWLGNAWFAARGARIIALQATVREQRALAAQETQALAQGPGAAEPSLAPMSSPDPLAGDEARLVLGGVPLELRRFGPGHFPGDAVVWLPGPRVAFAGDLVFADRMLGLLDNGSRVDQWARSFHAFESALHAQVIVPGHGRPCTPAQARAQTGDYLDWLIRETRPAAENMEDLEQAVTRIDAATPPGLRKLANAQELNRKNIQRAYLQFQMP
ncbi:MAG: MBL fold metallo-hydrolase [Betaproteobacteria bacterium]|nr:MBL fold metallo-hydrolase [Betaproteobacteria bacterium]